MSRPAAYRHWRAAAAGACALGVFGAVGAPGSPAWAKETATLTITGKAGDEVQVRAAGRIVHDSADVSFVEAEDLRVNDERIPFSAQWQKSGETTLRFTGPRGAYCVAVAVHPKDEDAGEPGESAEGKLAPKAKKRGQAAAPKKSGKAARQAPGALNGTARDARADAGEERVEKIVIGDVHDTSRCPTSADDLPHVGDAPPDDPGEAPGSADDEKGSGNADTPGHSDPGAPAGAEADAQAAPRPLPGAQAPAAGQAPILPQALPAYALVCRGDAATVRKGDVIVGSADLDIGIAETANAHGEWKTGLDQGPQLVFNAPDKDLEVTLTEANGPGEVRLSTIDPVGEETPLAAVGEKFTVPEKTSLSPTLSFTKPGHYSLEFSLGRTITHVHARVGEKRSLKADVPLAQLVNRCGGDYELRSIGQQQAVQAPHFERPTPRAEGWWLAVGAAFALGTALLALAAYFGLRRSA